MKEILDLQVSNGWFGAITFLCIVYHNNTALPERKLCIEISNPETS